MTLITAPTHGFGIGDVVRFPWHWRRFLVVDFDGAHCLRLGAEGGQEIANIVSTDVVLVHKPPRRQHA